MEGKQEEVGDDWEQLLASGPVLPTPPACSQWVKVRRGEFLWVRLSQQGEADHKHSDSALRFLRVIIKQENAFIELKNTLLAANICSQLKADKVSRKLSQLLYHFY